MVLTIALLGACDLGSMDPGSSTRLTAVAPAPGSRDVDVDVAVTIDFSRAMMPGEEQLLSLHRGGAGGSVVDGTWTWSENHRRVRFRPDSPLEHAMLYLLHVGGGMRDHSGRELCSDGDSHMGGAHMDRDSHMGCDAYPDGMDFTFRTR